MSEPKQGQIDQTMKKQPSIFISYTHEDRARITPLASYLGRIGLKVWMDTQDLLIGQPIIDAVSGAIEKSDLYVIGLTAANHCNGGRP